jgi:serpin B
MKRSLPALLAPLALLAALPVVAEERPAPADTAVVSGNNAFAFDLYGQLRSTEGNLFFSPYSISAALAMTSAGARGQTLDEMTKAMHYPEQEQLHPGFKSLGARLNGAPGEKRGYQLSTANALWGQKNYGFKAEFLQLTRDHYGAGLQEVNFAQPEEARKTINAWVEKETKDKIKDLIKPGNITVDTRLVLTNAIYFRGDWVSQFKKDQTKEEPFFLADGKQVKTPLMHQKGTFNYADMGAYHVVELPYVGKDLSMLVLLPKRKDGLAGLEKTLNADRLKAIQNTLNPTKDVDVTLPKFKTTAEFALNKDLQALGMKLAFAKEADFSGLNGGKEDLYIGFVVHKAFVDVNEEGTEAAAATAVGIEAQSKPPPPPVFRADHPFVYLIRDTRTGCVLFLGRLSDPTK